MRHGVFAVCVAVMVGAMLPVGGCTGQNKGESQQAVQEEAAASVSEQPLESAREATGTSLPYTEYVLPAGGKVSGYADRMACIIEPEPETEAYHAVRVLDLQTGEHARVIDCAVDREQGFDILSARCSDAWLVWEEMIGDALDDPLHVRWGLYAVPLEGCQRVGEPQLVAEAVSSAQSRPLYSVVGDTVYWMTNSAVNAEQEGVIDQARVWSRELPDGEERLLYRTGTDILTFSAQGQELLVTEAIVRGEEPGRLVVLEADSGTITDTVALGNTTWLSHYTAYRDGTCVWSVGDEKQAVARELLLRFPDGRRVSVAQWANDAIWVGDHLFFEQKPSVANGSYSRVDHWRVCVLDPETLEYSVLYDEEQRVFGWVAPIGVAPQQDQYVMYRSVPPWITEEPPGTWVRVYTLE